MDDLPDEYDIIIIGTGLAESIIAAAASRIGKTVLHLDNNDYYGGDWASFNLDNLQSYLEKTKLNPETEDNSSEYKLQNGNSIYNIKQEWHVEDDIDYKWKKCDILAQYRKFNIDLTPKLLFFKGHLIQLLITSNISRYAEFRSVTRVLTVLPCDTADSAEKKFKLSAVPCSRSDVFASKNVNVVEKRMLMKLLNSCISYKPNEENSEFKDFTNKTFMSYLKHKKLTENLIHYVLYAIAMGNSEIDCLEGVSRTKRFLSSLGYYGNTPFLYPMYGNGEIAQYFCRLCAVFGGIYCLKRPVSNIIIEEKEDVENETNLKKRKIYKNIVTGNQQLKSEHLVMGAGFAPKEFKKTNVEAGLSRGIFITDCSVLEDEHESLTLLKIPPIQDFAETVVLEVGKSSYVCPDGLYLVHMTCRQKVDAKSDLQPLAEKLFEMNPKFEKIKLENSEEVTVDDPSTQNENKDASKTVQNASKTVVNSHDDKIKKDRPNCLWSFYFNMHDTSECDFSKWDIPENIFLCGGPDLDLDYDHSVEEARKIFTNIYPDCEFLPRAPDPEEIVFGEDDTEDNSKTEQDNKDINTDEIENSPKTEEEASEEIKNIEKTQKSENLKDTKDNEIGDSTDNESKIELQDGVKNLLENISKVNLEEKELGDIVVEKKDEIKM